MNEGINRINLGQFEDEIPKTASKLKVFECGNIETKFKKGIDSL